MGLKKDLVIAKIRAAQESNENFVLSQKQMGIYEVQSEYEARAIINFLTNHDENSWNGTVNESYGDAKYAFMAMNYMLPGMPLIYSGQEYDYTSVTLTSF